MSIERSRKKWTKEEREYLKENWGVLKLDTMCKRLGRTKRAVEKVAYIDLKLGNQMPWYSLKEVSEMTGINKDTIRNRINKYNLPHHRAKTKQKPYMLDEVQIRKFLRENQDVWHYDNLTINLFENNTKWLIDKIEKDKTRTNKYKKTWTDEEDFILLDRLKRGYSYEEIAKELNRTVQGVYGRHKYKYRLKV